MYNIEYGTEMPYSDQTSPFNKSLTLAKQYDKTIT